MRLRRTLGPIVGLVLAVTLVPRVVAAGQPPSPPAPEQPDQPGGPRPQPSEMATGDAAFQRQDWAGAIEAYRRALSSGMNHSLLHFRLGYALHVTGHHEVALTHHRQAAHISHPALRIDAIYNAACACALLGKQQDALHYLELAVDAGFADLNQVRSDTDLDALREDPRFTAIVDGIGKTPRLHQWMDFFIGEWTCLDPEVEEILTLRIERPLERSHTLVSTSVQRAPPGRPDPAAAPHRTGAIYPDAAARKWVWIVADDMGTRMEFTGDRTGVGETTGMRFTGRQISPIGPGAPIRSTYTPRGDGRVIEQVEVSEDGLIWRTHHQCEYVRKPSAAPGATGGGGGAGPP